MLVGDGMHARIVTGSILGGYENTNITLHYGSMLRNYIHHQSTARYVLEFDNMKKFLGFIQLPNFNSALDVVTTFQT